MVDKQQVAAMSFHETLSHQHRNCDIALAGVEQEAIDGRWSDAERAFNNFLALTEDHFTYEEQVLFPALQQANPMTAQPVSVMQSDHTQIRELAADLQIALQERRRDLLQGASETLVFLLQQHNAKEESVLYPIADQLLDPQELPIQQSPHDGDN